MCLPVTAHTRLGVCLTVIKAVLWVLIRVHQAAALLRPTHNPSAYDLTQRQVHVYWRTSVHVYLQSDCAHHQQKHSDGGLCVKVTVEHFKGGVCCVCEPALV